MTKRSGIVYIGLDYAASLDEVKAITGARNHPDALRRLMDAVLVDSEIRRDVKAFIAKRHVRRRRRKTSSVPEASAPAGSASAGSASAGPTPEGGDFDGTSQSA